MGDKTVVKQKKMTAGIFPGCSVEQKGKSQPCFGGRRKKEEKLKRGNKERKERKTEERSCQQKKNTRKGSQKQPWNTKWRWVKDEGWLGVGRNKVVGHRGKPTKGKVVSAAVENVRGFEKHGTSGGLKVTVGGGMQGKSGAL